MSAAGPWRVVLVGPENPRNVGFVARAMACFGAEELFVAGTEWTAAPPEAFSTGAAAPRILEKARFVPDLAVALEDCADAVAFSRRPTVLRQDEFALPGAPADLGTRGRVALVFGRESNGLTRAESALCPRLARIPCRGGLSLNLGQAAAIALFSLAAPTTAAPPETRKARPRAAVERLLRLWDFLEPRLAAAPRYSQTRLQRTRQALYRLALDDEDFDLLFAAFRTLSRASAP